MRRSPARPVRSVTFLEHPLAVLRRMVVPSRVRRVRRRAGLVALILGLLLLRPQRVLRGRGFVPPVRATLFALALVVAFMAGVLWPLH